MIQRSTHSSTKCTFILLLYQNSKCGRKLREVNWAHTTVDLVYGQQTTRVTQFPFPQALLHTPATQPELLNFGHALSPGFEEFVVVSPFMIHADEDIHSLEAREANEHETTVHVCAEISKKARAKSPDLASWLPLSIWASSLTHHAT